jgi:universal stress protein A
MAFKKILVPVYVSDHAREAMRRAAELAVASGGSLTLLHVVHVPVLAYADGSTMMPSPGPQLTQELGDAADKSIAEWRHRAEEMGVRDVTARVAAGVPWQVIVETLEADPSFDLAVVGTHGRTGLGRALLGSVAERVVRHAPCPVLVVRQAHPA